jgi:hypothetical protein
VVGGQAVAEEAHQFRDPVPEAFRLLAGVRVQGEGRPAVRAWRAAEAEIDPAGSDRLEAARHLGDLQRRVVRQHDAGRADSDPARSRGDRRHHDLGRRPGMSAAVVMLGEPVPAIAHRLRRLGESDRLADRLGRAAALGDRRLVEDGERDHGAVRGRSLGDQAYTGTRPKMSESAP